MTWLISWVCILGTAQADDAEPRRLATEFLAHCREGRFEEAVGLFGAETARALPATRLEEVWTRIDRQLGGLKSLGDPRSTSAEGKVLVTVRCRYAASELDARIAVDSEGRITGFRLVQPQADESERAPYADASKFQETERTVGAEGWPLPATLTMPKGVERAPVVVLVHGSGPNDRDGTLGPNRPFRDLAHGLASRGVAVLRYEKRTRAHAERLKADEGDSIDLDAEVVDDALAALRQVREVEGIDPARVFLLGHSLGGSVAPRIAARDGKLAGLILLAAPARPADAIVLDQLEYLRKNDPTQSAALTVMIPQIRETLRRIRAGEALANEKVLGAPAGYWTSWLALDPAEDAAGLGDLPTLVLRGARDYQVVEEDVRLLQERLKDRAHVEFKIYPELNHIFQAGEGLCLPAEYNKPGHVDPRVIEDLARFVAAH